MRKFILSFISILFLFVSCDNFIDSDDSQNKLSLRYFAFQDSSITLGVGETKYIKLNLIGNMIFDSNVNYSSSQEGFISITGGSVSGCTVTGIGEGSVILKAECYGFTSFMEIKIGSGLSVIEPYIVLPYSVLEMKNGEKKSVIASLYGGAASDNNAFVWKSDSELISVTGLNNSCVIESHGYGVSRVTVSNPKAKYSSSFIVVVDNEENQFRYLTTSDNLIKLKSDGYTSFSIDLKGGNTSELLNVNYSVTEGKDVISLVPNLSKCTVNALKEGTARIKVSLSGVESLYITVVVSDDVLKPYIECSQSFFISEGFRSYDITCNVIGEVKNGWEQKFTYRIEDESVIKVTRANNVFHVDTIANGRSKLYIYNSSCELEKVIQFIVSETSLESAVCYIQTSDSFVYLEEGGDSYELCCELIGGNEADANSFHWTVSDSSVIRIDVTDGNVNYSRGITDEGYEAKCLVTPLKSGTATVRIDNERSDFYTVVTFRVYPKGVIVPRTVSLKGPSVILAEKGKNVPVELTVSGGSEYDAGVLEWNVRDSSVCSLTCDGLKAAVEGIKKGITELNVTGDKLKSRFSSIIISGTAEEIEGMNVFYSDRKYLEIGKKTVHYIEMKSLNPVKEDSYSVSVNDRSVCGARMSNNVLVVEGLKEGETELVVRSSDIEGYSYVMYVTCIDGDVSYDYPYVLSYPEFQGCLIGEKTLVSGKLLNAPPYKEDEIVYESDDAEICTVTGNGSSCYVTCHNEGECFVTVSHPKARKSARFCVYATNDLSILKQKVVMVSDRKNFIARKGDRLYLKLSVNNEERKKDIIWKINDLSIADIEGYEDSCICDVRGEGNFIVTASIDSTELNFYISVVNDGNAEVSKIVRTPSVVEILTGEIKNITLDTSNLDSNDIAAFEWSCGESGISLTGNGKVCRVKALKKGYYEIKVTNSNINYGKVIPVIVCDDEADFKTSYVLGLDDNYYSRMENESFDVRVKFGTYKLPEHLHGRIKWKSSSSCVELIQNGVNCTVLCVREGEAVVTVSSDDCVNSVSFKVDVFSADERLFYLVSVKKIVKLVEGNHEDIIYSCYNANTHEDTGNYDSFTVRSDNSDIAATSCMSNFIRIDGKKKGSTKVYIENSNYDLKVPVYVHVYATEEELLESFNCHTEKNSYLIKEGEEKTVPLILEDYSEEVTGRMSVSCGDSSVISCSIDGSDVYIKGLKTGSSVLTVSHDGKKVHSFNVSVTDKDNTSGGKILTESIISLCLNEKYVPSVSVSGDGVYRLDLSKTNDVVVKRFDDEKSIYGYIPGRCEVYVRSGNSYRVIRAGVFETEEEKKTFHEFNIDERYRFLNVGDSISLSPLFFYDGDVRNTVYEDLSFNGVVSMKNENGILTVKGLNEGIQEIKVSNTDFEPFIIYFEVRSSLSFKDTVNDGDGGSYGGADSTGGSGNGSGGSNNNIYDMNIDDDVKVETVIDTRKLFTYKNVYYMENNDTDGVVLNVYEKGINGSGEKNEFYWNVSDDSLVDYEDNGNYMRIYPKGKDGIVTVTCGSKLCSNILQFNVRIGSLYQENTSKIKYIYSAVNTVGLIYRGDSITVPVRLVNMDEYSVSGIKIEKSNVNICNVSSEIIGDILYLKFVPVSVGVGRVVLTHPSCDIETCIDYIVYEGIENDIVYLTTNDNYLIVKTGESRNASVSLKNMTEIDQARFSWKVGDSSVCSLIGSGSSLQVRGLKEGKTDIVVTHPESRNEITIHVIVSDVISNIAYLSCASNIIETKVSGVMDSFKVNVCGKDAGSQSRLKYRSLDTSVLNVVGNNDYCYYRGLKKGISQIEVSYDGDDSIEPLLVTVIVEDSAVTDSYLSCQNSIIYMNPFGSSRTMNLTYNGKGSFDSSKIQWYLYSQDIKDNVDGNVCTLTASGSKAVIVPYNPGIAKIRAVYPPENLKFNIIVFVSNTDKLSFVEDSVSVYKGDSVFTEVECPDFNSNMNRFLSYESDNENVCSAVGTSKVCYIMGNEVGNAIVKVKNDYDDSEAVIAVKVLNPDDENNVKIITSDTAVSLNPRSSSVKLTAILSGAGVLDSDSDDIEWSISGDAQVSIYPDRGREVVLSVADDGNVIKDGEAVITLTHSKCPSGFKKTIYVNLKEVSDYFVLESDSAEVDVGSTIVLSSLIKGASQSDYEKVKWSVDGLLLDEDGNYVETARVMNLTGQDCTVYGLKEGTARVTAYYNGDIKTCSISVKGMRYFNFSTGVIYSYPGKEIELEYQIKPSTVIPTFFMSNSSGNSASDIVEYSVDYERKILKIKSLGEGNVTVTGMANGVGTATCTLYSRYNPKIVNKYRNKNGEYEQSINFTMLDDTDRNYSGNILKIPFVCYPPLYYTGYEVNGGDSSAYTVRLIENHRDEEEDGNDGLSWIEIEFHKEVPSGMDLVLTQYSDEAKKNQVSDANGNLNQLVYKIRSHYNYADGEYYNVVFERNDGFYSGFGSENNWKPKLNARDLDDNRKVGEWGDGETHYIIITPKHKGQYFENIDLTVEGNSPLNVVNRWTDSQNGIKRYVYEVKAENDFGFDCKYDGKSWEQPLKDAVPDDDFYNRFGIRESDWTIDGKKYKGSELIKNGKWTSYDSCDWESCAPWCGAWRYGMLYLDGFSDKPLVMCGSRNLVLVGQFTESEDEDSINQNRFTSDGKPYRYCLVTCNKSRMTDEEYQWYYKELQDGNNNRIYDTEFRRTNKPADITSWGEHAYTGTKYVCLVQDINTKKIVYGLETICGDYWSWFLDKYFPSSGTYHNRYGEDTIQKINDYLNRGLISVDVSSNNIAKDTLENDNSKGGFLEFVADYYGSSSLEDELKCVELLKTGFNIGNKAGSDSYNFLSEAFYKGTDFMNWPSVYSRNGFYFHYAQSHIGAWNPTPTPVGHHWYHAVSKKVIVKVDIKESNPIIKFHKDEFKLRNSYDGLSVSYNLDLWKNRDWIDSGNGFNYPSDDTTPVYVEDVIFNFTCTHYSPDSEDNYLSGETKRFKMTYKIRNCYRNYPKEDISHHLFEKK